MKRQIWTAVTTGLLLGFMLGADAASAAPTQFKVTVGDWTNVANWSAGIPTNNEADIGSNSKNPATANINPGDNLTCGPLYIAQWGNQTGAVNQSGGLLDLGSSNLSLASYGNVGASAMYTLSGGVLSNALLNVASGAKSNTAVFVLSGGTFYGTAGAGTISPTIGQSVGSSGRVVQTSGAFVNSANKDLTIGREGGVGVYELSGGVLTNGLTITLGMNAATTPAMGTLLLSGTGAVFCSSWMYLGFGSGGVDTGIVFQSGGLCQPGGLKLGGYAKGVGRYDISGGQLVSSIDIGSASPSVGTMTISSNASISVSSAFNVGAAWATTGTVLQTGGTVDLHATTLSVGGYSPSLGQYTLSGGMLTNVGKMTICVGSNGVGSVSIGGTAVVGLQSGCDLTVANSAYGLGTLQIVGAQASIAPFNNFTHNKAGSTLDLLFSSDGITALRPKYTSLGGTLKLGLNGGVALFRTNAFACIQAQNTISTDFTTKNSGVFTVAASGTNYMASLDAAKRVTTKTLASSDQVLSFSATNRGWFAVSVPTTGSTTNVDLLLSVTTSGSTPVAELDSLATNMALSGYTVTRISSTWTKPNMRVSLPTTTAGATNYFAWDLTRFDASLAIGSIGNTARGTSIFIR